jgi:hypothetical protein
MTAQAGAGRVHPAIEEFLRYESPFSLATLRCASEPVVLGTATIATGEFVHIGLGSANREPRTFEEPDRLDIGWDTRRHFAFATASTAASARRRPAWRLKSRSALCYGASRTFGSPDDVRWQQNPRHRGLLSPPVRTGTGAPTG